MHIYCADICPESIEEELGNCWEVIMEYRGLIENVSMRIIFMSVKSDAYYDADRCGVVMWCGWCMHVMV